MEVFFINVRHFVRFLGFLKTFSKKWLLFRNVRLL
jgi:hypothetical protein